MLLGLNVFHPVLVLHANVWKVFLVILFQEENAPPTCAQLPILATSLKSALGDVVKHVVKESFVVWEHIVM